MEKRPNTGALFAVKTKTNPKAPDYSGDILIDLSSMNVKDGKVEVRLAGWKRQTKNGAVFLSLMVDKYEKKEVKTPAQQIQEMDDDVPF
jgi:hypothetical protein